MSHIIIDHNTRTCVYHDSNGSRKDNSVLNSHWELLRLSCLEPNLSWLLCSDFRLTPENINLILSIYFAMEEINRNPQILPNISLLATINCHVFPDHIKSFHSSKRSEYFPNYYCSEERRHLITLTGPRWRVSAIFGVFLCLSRTPEVSLGGLILMKYFPFRLIFWIQMVMGRQRLGLCIFCFIKYKHSNTVGNTTL